MSFDLEQANNTKGNNNAGEECDKTIRAFIFDQVRKKLQILDQTLLPKEIKYVEVTSSDVGYSVIKSMMVRGAPCIAAVGCLSLIVELNEQNFSQDKTVEDVILWLETKSCHLIESRPTAVNLRNALNKLMDYAMMIKGTDGSSQDFIEKLTGLCFKSLESGIDLNKRLGYFGAEALSNNGDGTKITILTHCNTGALATVGYGTALGVIRSLYSSKMLEQAYCTETRPYNQGSRLTAWELVQERIPATLIADSMVAYLMQTNKIDAVIVGADCVAANGDTANKIGTLQIAVVAKEYGVPFYVAAPTQSIDLSIEDQSEIEIEQRPAKEMKCIGDIVLAPDEIDVWNPCFDITPAKYITGIMTEYGVCKPDELVEFLSKFKESIRDDSALF